MKSFCYTYEMYSPDLTPESNLKLTSLMGYLQDISTRHYRALAGEKDTEALWVIVSWDIQLHRDVHGLQRIRVETTPVYFRRFLAIRAYKVFDEAGELVAEGYSKWAVIHRETHQPHPVSDEFYVLFEIDKHNQMMPKLEAPYPPASFVDTDQETSVRDYVAVAQDIDLNQHVNNIAYIRWALDSVSTEFLRDRSIASLRVSYKKEGMEGEPVVIESQKNARSLRTKVQNRAGDVLSLVEIVWR